jgi:putative redox protein
MLAGPYHHKPDFDMDKTKNSKSVAVVVEAGSLTAQITSGKHVYLVDEPEEVGGKALGPTPYDYLLAALGSCTAITMRMYANLKGWPLGRIEVELSHERVHAADCANCDMAGAKLDQVHKTLTLHGDLSPEQLQRLEVISSRCPVQKTLTAGIAVKTTLNR